MPIDLREAPIVDAHCHGFRRGDLLSRDPEGFETRLTLMGMCQMTSAGSDPDLWRRTVQLTGTTPYSLAARRWLAERLGCETQPEAVAAARHAALASDPAGYVRSLLVDSLHVGLVADEGFPLPPVPRAEFEAAVGGVPVHRVVRIEPLIAELRDRATGVTELTDALEAELERAADDPQTVGFKSIIAYRTGLDVRPVAPGEAAAAFDRWRAGGWTEDRVHAKAVRDHLLDRTLRAARRLDMVMHIHTGDGDPDIDLGHARPHDLYPFLREHQRQPIVLIHGGHPWSPVAAYIASLLPNVYIDLSVLLPWTASAAEQLLSTILGMVPWSKVLYGSDQASEPEVFWLSARIARRALERALADAVDRDFLTEAEATRAGADVLGANCLRLHGVAGP